MALILKRKKERKIRNIKEKVNEKRERGRQNKKKEKKRKEGERKNQGKLILRDRYLRLITKHSGQRRLGVQLILGSGAKLSPITKHWDTQVEYLQAQLDFLLPQETEIDVTQQPGVALLHRHVEGQDWSGHERNGNSCRPSCPQWADKAMR